MYVLKDYKKIISSRKFLRSFLIIFFLGLIVLLTRNGILKEPTVLSEANKINNVCKSSKLCLNDQFYQLSKQTNLANATKVLFSLQKLNPEASTGCHLIAHRITQAETEKNPKAWKDILKKVSPSICTGGFLHGVLEVHERTDPGFNINDKTVSAICKELLSDTATGERSCYHNMGHLMLIQTHADIDESVNECSKLSDSNASYECLSGAFMENLTSENLVAHGFLKTRVPWNNERAKQVEELCNKYQNTSATKACWKELSYIFTTIHKQDPKELYKECQNAPEKSMSDECYVYGVGNIVNMPRIIKSDLINLCKPVQGDKKVFDYCMRQVVWTLVTSNTENTDRALNLCDVSPSGYKISCVHNIITYLQINKVKGTIIAQACDKISPFAKPKSCKI